MTNEITVMGDPGSRMVNLYFTYKGYIREVTLTKDEVAWLTKALYSAVENPGHEYVSTGEDPLTQPKGHTLPELREIAPPDPIPELKSSLPHGVPFPVGDADLWAAVMTECGITKKDTMQRYADVRGITRLQAKNETFTIRYGGSRVDRYERGDFSAPEKRKVGHGLAENVFDQSSVDNRPVLDPRCDGTDELDEDVQSLMDRDRE